MCVCVCCVGQLVVQLVVEVDPVCSPMRYFGNICPTSQTLSITSDGSSLVSSWQLTLQALPHVWPAMTADGLHDIAALVLKVLTSAVKCR